MTRQLDLHLALVSVTGICLFYAADASAQSVQISSDPFSNSSSQHMTEVEPQIYANGSTIVAAFQQGRIFGGGSSDIGFSNLHRQRRDLATRLAAGDHHLEWRGP